MKYTKNIPAESLDTFAHEIQKLNKKSRKFNLPDTTFEVLEEFFQRSEKGDIQKKLHVEITTFDTIFNGWTFICRRDHTPEGIIILGYGHPISDTWYHIPGICQHCNTNHQRNQTYVIQHTTTQEYKIIGSSCLQKYLGNPLINKILNLFHSLQSRDFDQEYKGSRDPYLRTDTTLATTSAIIKTLGYKKASDEGINTATLVTMKLNNYTKHHPELNNINISDQDHFTATNTIAYFKELPIDYNNSYTTNLKTLLSSTYYNQKHHNLIVSAVQSYLNTQKSKTEYKGFFGTPSTRYKGLNLTLISKKCMGESDWGIQFKYEFTNSENNLFQWYTNEGAFFSDNEINKSFTIDAFVKAHKEYKVGPVTILNRVKCKD